MATDRIFDALSSLAIKAPCKAATTANITLSGLQAADGVSLAQDDRVLVKDQTTGSENGIYLADTGTWARGPDFDGNKDVVKATQIPIDSGTTNAGFVYRISTSNPIVIGTTSIAFELASISDLSGSSFLQAGVGAVSRNGQIKLREILSVVDFGATGDGVTDDTTAIANAFAAAITFGAGTFKGATIKFPAGDYLITTLDFSVATQTVANIQCVGDGGETGSAATRLIFKPGSSSSTGLLLKSVSNFEFLGIEFIAGNSNCSEVILMHSWDSPVESSYMNKFGRCSFRNFTGETVDVALISMKNSASTFFEQCRWSGDQNAVRLGENAGVDASTFGNGAVGHTKFNSCLISTDILVRRSINTMFINTEFGRNGTTLVPARIIPEGDKEQRNTSIIGCTNLSVNAAGTGTFYTQGTSGKSLYAVNNRLKSYAVNFLIDAGGCYIKNNLFQDMGSAQIGIQLGANATECEGTPNDFADLITNARTPIDDNRLAPRWPRIIDQSLGSDYTFTATGVFEDIISVSGITHNGGALRVRWSAFLNSADAATYTFQFLIDGSIVSGLSDRAVVGSGDDRHFHGEIIINQDTHSTGVIFKLQGEQSAGTLSVIEAQGTTFSTFIQVEEL